MGLALEKARAAFVNGEFPVGCVVVLDNRVIADSSRQGTSGDRKKFSEIDHAEIICLKNIEKAEIIDDLSNAVLFCTMEPCLMCFGAIILAGIRKIVYAYEDPMGGATCCDLNQLPLLYKKSKIEVVSGIMRDKSLNLFCQFFKKNGNQYWKDSLLEIYTIEQEGKEK
ncbi:MAG: nucleoside deaminase [Desulfobacteraceae bacterium]|nr:nucleoside deaminase [Desulfobacteraceae bacterium]